MTDEPQAPLGAGPAPRRLLVSTVDQALSSASNFTLVFLIARGSDPHDFGVLILGYSIVTFALAMQRGAFGALLGMDLPTMGAAARVPFLRKSLAGCLLLSLPPTAILAVTAWLLLPNEAVAWALLVLACATPVVILQDLHRFWAVADAKPSRALFADLLWLVVVLGAFLAGLGSSHLSSPAIGASAWLMGAVLSLLWMVGSGQRELPEWRGLRQWLRGDPRRGHLTADAALQSTAPLGNAFGAALIAGPAVTAAVRGAGTLFGPLNVLGAATALGAVPEAKRADPRGAAQVFRLVGFGLTIAAVCWGAVMMLVPTSFGQALLGQTWASVRVLLVYTTIEYVGLALWTRAVAIFRVYDATRTALAFRGAHSVLSLILPLVAVAVFGTAVSFSISLAILGVCLGLGSTVYAARVRRGAIACLPPGRQPR